MCSGFRYLSSELRYKSRLEWLVLFANGFGILTASVNIFTGNWVLFLVLAMLNLSVLMCSLLGAYRYLPASSFMILNIVGAVTRYTAFKHQQTALILALKQLHQQLNVQFPLSGRDYNSMGVATLTELVDNARQCIVYRQRRKIEKEIHLHNQAQELRLRQSQRTDQ